VKDCFGREISLNQTIAYAMNTHGLAFYKVTKVNKDGISGLKYLFDKSVPSGYEFSYRAVGLNDASKMMIIDKNQLPINEV
jgi:hypothetical protein